MPADVRILRWTGPVTTPTTSLAESGRSDITSINTRANAMDAQSTADTTNPVQIPASGYNYSFWVTTRLYVNSTPAGTINNFRWYSSGSNNFGTGILCNGNNATSYVQATGTAGQTGNQLTTLSHAGLTASPVNVFSFTQANPKQFSGLGVISNPATGDAGDFFVYQVSVDPTASAGTSTPQTFTFKYDET